MGRGALLAVHLPWGAAAEVPVGSSMLEAIDVHGRSLQHSLYTIYSQTSSRFVISKHSRNPVLLYTHKIKKQSLTYLWPRNSSALRGQKGTKASLLQSGPAASLSSAGLTLSVRWPSSPSLCTSALQEPPCMDSLLSTRVTSSFVEACHQD